MYWLVLSTLFWAATYSTFNSKAECRDSAYEAPWYVSASCIPFPKPQEAPHHDD